MFRNVNILPLLLLSPNSVGEGSGDGSQNGPQMQDGEIRRISDEGVRQY